MNTILASALIAGSMGYAVLAVVVGGKKPLHVGWQAEATTEPTLIRRLLADAALNYGLYTRDFVVFDFDVVDLARQFYQRYRHRITTMVQTPRGGVHFYFSGTTANSQNAGFDIRGRGGFAVGPTSKTANGEYRLITPLVPLADLKPFPADYLPERKRYRSRPIEECDVIARTRRARLYLATLPPAVQGQRGSDVMFRACCLLFQKFGLTRDQAIGPISEFNARALPPFSDPEIAHKLADAERATHEEPHHA